MIGCGNIVTIMQTKAPYLSGKVAGTPRSWVRSVVLWLGTLYIAGSGVWLLLAIKGQGSELFVLSALVFIAFAVLSVVSMYAKQYSKAFLGMMYVLAVMGTILLTIIVLGYASDVRGELCTGFFGVSVSCVSESIWLVEAILGLLAIPLAVVLLVIGVLQAVVLKRAFRA